MSLTIETGCVPDLATPVASVTSNHYPFAELNSIVNILEVGKMSSNIERLKLETELNKSRFRLQQLLLEKQVVVEQFRMQEKVYEEEIANTMAKLGGADADNVNVQSQVASSTREEKTLGNIEARPEPSAPVILESDTPQMLYPNLMKIESHLLPSTNKFVGQGPLDPLRVLEQVSIRQLSTEGLNEAYDLLGPGDKLVYTANLIFPVIHSKYIPSHKRFRLNFGNSQYPEAFTFRRGLDHLDLFVCDQKVSTICRQQTLSKIVLLICDRHNQPLLKIKGPLADHPYEFTIQTLDKDSIGTINKEVKSLSTHYVCTNHTTINFPEDMDVGCKAAIIGASFLIVNKSYDKVRKAKCRNSGLNEDDDRND